MGNPDRPELGEELTNSFCRTDPDIAKQFARVTFLSDNRADLPRVTRPSLILQCADDAIAPDRWASTSIGICRQSLVHMEARATARNLSAPEETVCGDEGVPGE